MSLDDVIYVICLLTCIGIGKYVRAIPKENLRKYFCTLFGLLMVVVVSGIYSLHCLLSVILGGIAITYVHPSKCHLTTFIIMFSYLTFFRLVHLFGLESPPGHTNMIQMVLTLKVTGLAFEKNASWKKLSQYQASIEQNSNKNETTKISFFDREVQKIDFLTTFHYAFNYIGVLTGPYYRYRTYVDYFRTPFKSHSPCVESTISKLKFASLYCLLYLTANYIWPLEYALSEDFYTNCSFLYRLMYIWPTFFIFRMRMYTGLTLSECVCTMAGFGAYPDVTNSSNGEGPTEYYDHLIAEPQSRTYNFQTIVNTRVKNVETCWTFREAMKHWNICVQYWLAANVYKLFPYKKYRTGVTLLCSAYWHGFRPGHYFCIMGAPFYVPLEDMWNKLIRKDAVGLVRHIIDIIFWISKFFAFSYLGIAFQLTTLDRIWRYYNSVYHVGYVAWAFMMLLGLYLTKKQRASERTQKNE